MISEQIEVPRLKLPFLGFFGGWGIGKPSTLRLVEREFRSSSDQYLIIELDAWLYQGFDDA